MPVYVRSKAAIAGAWLAALAAMQLVPTSAPNSDNEALRFTGTSSKVALIANADCPLSSINSGEAQIIPKTCEETLNSVPWISANQQPSKSRAVRHHRIGRIERSTIEES